MIFNFEEGGKFPPSHVSQVGFGGWGGVVWRENYGTEKNEA